MSSSCVYQNGENFVRHFALYEKFRLQLAFQCLLNRARRRKYFFQPLKTEETCNSAHEQTSVSNDTLDFVLRKWEVVQAKELSEHPRISNYHAG